MKMIRKNIVLMIAMLLSLTAGAVNDAAYMVAEPSIAEPLAIQPTIINPMAVEPTAQVPVASLNMTFVNRMLVRKSASGCNYNITSQTNSFSAGSAPVISIRKSASTPILGKNFAGNSSVNPFADKDKFTAGNLQENGLHLSESIGSTGDRRPGELTPIGDALIPLILLLLTYCLFLLIRGEAQEDKKEM